MSLFATYKMLCYGITNVFYMCIGITVTHVTYMIYYYKVLHIICVRYLNIEVFAHV